MKILLLSFYFAPDLSAGSFRMTALVRALSEQLGPDDSIDVVTTQPNRYRSFRAEVPADEHTGNVRIRRIALPPHESGMADQSRAFFTYQRSVRALIQGEHYDAVFATSSRLFTAVLGSWIARRRGVPFYADIRDIFVDTIKDVLPGAAGPLARFTFSGLERYAVRRAITVNLVSEGFGPYFRKRYQHVRYSFFTNGIDDEFLDPIVSTPLPRTEANRALTQILYAGNMGEGQGLTEIVPPLARALAGKAQFTIIGDGGRRHQLEELVAAEGLRNVEILPPMNRQNLIAAYRAADILFMHLNDYDAFRKVLPSKLFEYAATGKPIWAGVAGYAADFLREHVSNATVFAPCDASAAERQFDGIDLAFRPRDAFVHQFARKTISHAMADDILSVFRAASH